MGQIIELKAFRQRKRKAFLGKHGARLRRFVARFIELHLHIDFTELTRRYQEELRRSSEVAWDYDDLREVLHGAFEVAFGEELKAELARERWYDPCLIPFFEVIDACLSVYILGGEVSADERVRERF